MKKTTFISKRSTLAYSCSKFRPRPRPLGPGSRPYVTLPQGVQLFTGQRSILYHALDSSNGDKQVICFGRVNKRVLLVDILLILMCIHMQRTNYLAEIIFKPASYPWPSMKQKQS